jgi:hypothetical protein
MRFPAKAKRIEHRDQKRETTMAAASPMRCCSIAGAMNGGLFEIVP